ncbi:MAG: Hint domain-containing protein [Pseudomonadota bacterium]
MSVRSDFDEAGETSGFEAAVSRLRDGASRLRAERARQMQRAANAGDAIERLVTREVSQTPSKTLHAWPLPGLAPMTRVRTNFGDVHAAALRKGDEVLTRSGAYLPILWLNRIRLDERILAEKPDCNPVVFAAGAFGPQVPAAEIMVSPRQVVCAGGKSGLANSQEAARLTTRPGIRRIKETSLSYTMFHLGEAAEVYCEGVFLMFPMDA